MLAAERSRARLFSEGLRPRFVLEPPPAVELHLDALDLLRQGRLAEASEALDSAGALQAPLRGTAGEVVFDLCARVGGQFEIQIVGQQFQYFFATLGLLIH